VKRSRGILILIHMFVLIVAVSLWTGLCSAEESSPAPQIPVEGKITMVDFWENGCVGCMMQASAIKSLEKKYQNNDQVAIVYVNINSRAGLVAQYQIERLPTQIFYDKNGKEVYRHIGIMFESSIDSRLTKMKTNQ
jgi:thioredoxin 1